MKKIILYSLVLAVACLGAQAPESAAQVALPSLNTAIGARAVAMGEAYSAVADDESAVFWNPAGLAQLDRPMLGLSYNKWFMDLSQQNFGAALPLGPLALGGQLAYLSFGSFEIRDEGGYPTGESTRPYNLSGSLAAAGRAGPVCVGLAAKFSREVITDYSVSGFGADLGVMYIQGSLRLGLSARNLGKAGDFSIPQNFRAGAAYLLGFEEVGLLLSTDAKLSSKGTSMFNSGIEVGYRKTLFLRAGYKWKFEDDFLGWSSRVSGGVGVKYAPVRFDYAIAPYGELGTTHRTSLGMEFGGSTQRTEPDRQTEERVVDSQVDDQGKKLSLASYREGLAYEKTKDYRNAVKRYIASVKMNDGNAQAWKRLGAIYLRYTKKDMAVKCLRRYLELKPGDEKVQRIIEKLIAPD